MALPRRTIANNINSCLDQGTLVECTSPSQDNFNAYGADICVNEQSAGRKKLLKMERGLFSAAPAEASGKYTRNILKKGQHEA